MVCSDNKSNLCVLRFSGQLLRDDAPVLVQLAFTPSSSSETQLSLVDVAVTVNVADMIVGGVVIGAVKRALSP